jgi:hypothetical protein
VELWQTKPFGSLNVSVPTWKVTEGPCKYSSLLHHGQLISFDLDQGNEPHEFVEVVVLHEFSLLCHLDESRVSVASRSER